METLQGEYLSGRLSLSDLDFIAECITEANEEPFEPLQEIEAVLKVNERRYGDNFLK